MKELIHLPRGLILVTGPTGSGKSTSLASMINVINEQKRLHIVTVEDPIEYLSRSQARHRQPARGRRGRADFRGGTQARAAAGPGRDPRGRDARPGNHGGGHHRRRNGPPGLLHAAHHRRVAHGGPHHRLVPGRSAGADPHPVRGQPQGGAQPGARAPQGQQGAGWRPSS